MKRLSHWFGLVVCFALAACGGGGGAGADGASAPTAAEPAQVLATSNALLDAEGAAYRLGIAQSAAVSAARASDASGVTPEVTAPVAPAAAAATVATAASAPAAAPVPIVVTKLTKVSESRVSRTVFDYVFKLELLNQSGQNRANAAARLAVAGKGTTIVDGLVLAPTLDAQQTATPADTVTLRHDRSVPFDVSALAWTTSSLLIVDPPAAQITVNQVELKPGVREVSALVSVSPNGTEWVSDVDQAWPVGTVLLHQGLPRKVTGRTKDAQGKFHYSVEEVSLLHAVDNLAFDLVTHAIPYGNDGLAVALNGKGQRRALSQSRKTGGASITAEEPKLFDLQCLLPGATVKQEGAEEYGVAMTLNCSAAELLEGVTGIDADGIKLLQGLRIDGAFEKTSKTEYHVNTKQKDNYSETAQTFGFKGRVSMNLADRSALVARMKRNENCKSDEGAVTCTFEPPKLRKFSNFFVPAGALQVPVHAEFGFLFEFTFSADAGIEVDFKVKRNITAGIKDNQKISIRPVPKAEGWEPPKLDKEFTGNAEVMAKLGGSGSVSVGYGWDKTNSLVAADFSIAGYARLAAETGADVLLCTTAERGIAIGFGLNLIRLESIGFDGIDLLDSELLLPTAKADWPSDCAKVASSKRVRLAYSIDPESRARINANLSDAGQDGFDLTAHVLLDRRTNPARRITLDFGGTAASTFLPANIEYSIRPVAGSLPSITATGAVVPYDGWFDGARFVAQVDTGLTAPGQSVLLEVEAWVKNKSETTRTRRLIQLKFEKPLAATASFHKSWRRSGSEWNTVDIQYLDDSHARTARAFVETSTGERFSVQSLIADPSLLDHSATTSAEAVPVALWMSTRDDGGALTSYRVEITPDLDAVITGVSFDPAVPRLGQATKLHVAGRNLPDDLQFTFPGCWELKEIDFEAFEPYSAGSEDRLLTCNVAKAGAAVALSALSGQWRGAVEVAGLPDDLHIASDKASAGVGEMVQFALRTAQEYGSLLISVVWDFANESAQRAGNFFQAVSYAFTTAASHVVDAYLLMYNGAKAEFVGLISRTFEVDAPAGVTVTSVTPLTAIAGVAQAFDVIGANMPLGLVFTLKDCDNPVEVQVGTNPSLRRFTCTFAPTAAAGSYDGSVALGSSIFSPAPYFDFKVSVSRVVLNSVQPAQTIRSIATSFEFTGPNLPTTGLSVVPVGNDGRSNCQAPTNAMAGGFGVACELFKVGTQVLEVRHGSQVLGTSTVTVASNVTGVSWTSPSTANSGTVKFGETVTFTVRGENLTTDPVMGFAVERCGVSNEEVGVKTATQRTFTCWFNNEAGAVAGQMLGVVKDAPGGQVLFDGWKVPVEVPASGATAASGDLSSDFSAAQNPNGQWSYGWSQSLGSAFTKFNGNLHPPIYGALPELKFWSDTAEAAFAIAKNVSASAVSYGCCAPHTAASGHVPSGSDGAEDGRSMDGRCRRYGAGAGRLHACRVGDRGRARSEERG